MRLFIVATILFLSLSSSANAICGMLTEANRITYLKSTEYYVKKPTIFLSENMDKDKNVNIHHINGIQEQYEYALFFNQKALEFLLKKINYCRPYRKILKREDFKGYMDNSIQLFLNAASQGHIDSALKLYSIYSGKPWKGVYLRAVFRGGKHKNPYMDSNIADIWIKRAFANGTYQDFAESGLEQDFLRISKHNEKRRLDLIKNAADQNYIPALKWYAAQNKYPELKKTGVSKLETLANSGNIEAMITLGTISLDKVYLESKSINDDFLHWFKKAAEAPNKEDRLKIEAGLSRIYCGTRQYRDDALCKTHSENRKKLWEERKQGMQKVYSYLFYI